MRRVCEEGFHEAMSRNGSDAMKVNGVTVRLLADFSS